MTPAGFREWGRAVVDVMAGLLGMAMLGYETIVEKADRPWIIAAGVTLLGYPFVASVDRWLRRGNGNGDREGA